MYCPVDGTEWREGITRCPEHDVELVPEPPEDFEDLYDDVSLLDRLSAEGLVRSAVAVVAVAAIVYAVAGVVGAGLFALATTRDWRGLGPLQLVSFVQDSGRAVALGGLGGLAAGILGRAWRRLGTRAEEPTPRAEDDDDDERWLYGPAGWIVSLLTAFVIVFTLVWVVTGVALSLDQAELQTQAPSPFGYDEPDETFITLSAVNNAAYTCALGALVSLGALLMARGYDRIAARR